MAHYFDADENQSIRAVADVDDSTTAFVFDTKRNKTAGNLLEIKNSGVQTFAVEYSNARAIVGNNKLYLDGTPDWAEVFSDNYSGYSFDLYADYSRSYLYLTANRNGNQIDAVNLRPAMDDNSLTPFLFDTSVNRTPAGGGKLMQVKNYGTAMFTIGLSGDCRLTPMTKAVRSGISPTAGTIIYQLGQNSGFRFYDGAQWLRFSGINDD